MMILNYKQQEMSRNSEVWRNSAKMKKILDEYVKVSKTISFKDWCDERDEYYEIVAETTIRPEGGDDSTGIMEMETNFYFQEEINYAKVNKGFHLGEMRVYKTPRTHTDWWWADGHSQSLAEVYDFKIKMCDYDHDDWDEESEFFEHFILDHYELDRRYVGIGLGYECLYKGLMNSGCKNGYIYLQAAEISMGKDSKWYDICQDRLFDFYKNMDKDVQVLDKKEGILVCKCYDYDGNARQSSTLREVVAA